jgi:hypothetical protein
VSPKARGTTLVAVLVLAAVPTALAPAALRAQAADPAAAHGAVVGAAATPAEAAAPAGVVPFFPALPGVADQAAQDATPRPRQHRRIMGAVVGLAIGAVPAVLATDRPDRGFCSSRACLTTLGATMGTTVGYLIGRGLDDAAVRRGAGLPGLRMRRQPLTLEVEPVTVVGYPGGAVVLAREGLAVVEVGQMTPRLRGGALRVLAAVPLAERDAIVAGTATGLFGFPLRGEGGEGRQLASDPGGVLAAVGGDQVVVWSRDQLRRYRVTGQGAGLQLTEEARSDAPVAITKLVHSPFSGVLWALEGQRLVAYSTSQLEEVGSVGLPAPALTLAMDGPRAVISLGHEGLLVADVSSSARPALVGRMTGLRFAHGLAMIGTRVYVATGHGGLLVLDVTEPTAVETLGVVRDLGFVQDVAVAPSGELLVLDRGGSRLIRVTPDPVP